MTPQPFIHIELEHISTPISEFAIGVEPRSFGKALDYDIYEYVVLLRK